MDITRCFLKLHDQSRIVPLGVLGLRRAFSFDMHSPPGRAAKNSFNERCKFINPALDRGMINMNSSHFHDLFNIAIAYWKCKLKIYSLQHKTSDSNGLSY
jgi:hypothetical protein